MGVITTRPTPLPELPPEPIESNRQPGRLYRYRGGQLRPRVGDRCDHCGQARYWLVGFSPASPPSSWRPWPTRFAMPEPNPALWLRFVKSMLGLLGSASLQGAVCLSSGAALAALGVLLGRSLNDLTLLFSWGWPYRCGRCAVSPERIVRRRFALWNSWVELEISKTQCKRWAGSCSPGTATGSLKLGSSAANGRRYSRSWKTSRTKSGSRATLSDIAANGPVGPSPAPPSIASVAGIPSTTHRFGSSPTA